LSLLIPTIGALMVLDWKVTNSTVSVHMLLAGMTTGTYRKGMGDALSVKRHTKKRI